MDGDDQDEVSVVAYPLPGGMRFAVAGALDLSNAEPVAHLLEHATRDLDVVVIDLDAVTVLDSRGVAELHRLHRSFAGSGRSLRVAASPHTVAGKVLRLTGLDEVWNGGQP